MNNKILSGVWAGLYILCAGLGFIQEPTGILKWILVALSLAFFLPGFLLIFRGQAKLVRNLSAAALGVTLVVIILNILSVNASQGTGEFLYALLGLVSAPMFCAQYWVLSMFLWACLLLTAVSQIRKNKGGS